MTRIARAKLSQAVPKTAPHRAPAPRRFPIQSRAAERRSGSSASARASIPNPTSTDPSPMPPLSAWSPARTRGLEAEPVDGPGDVAARNFRRDERHGRTRRDPAAPPLTPRTWRRPAACGANFCDVAASAARAKSLNRPLHVIPVRSVARPTRTAAPREAHVAVAAQRRREGSRMRSTAVFRPKPRPNRSAARFWRVQRSSAPLNGTSGCAGGRGRHCRAAATVEWRSLTNVEGTRPCNRRHKSSFSARSSTRSRRFFWHWTTSTCVTS